VRASVECFSVLSILLILIFILLQSQQITFKMLWSKILQPRKLKLTLFDSSCVQETGCVFREKLEILVVNYYTKNVVSTVRTVDS
jgi:hypothetical protein